MRAPFEIAFFEFYSGLLASANVESSDPTNLVASIDDSVHTQGLKSLKGVAAITDSLNKTITLSYQKYASTYPTAHNDTYVKATLKYSTSYWPYFATDPSKSLTGSDSTTSWKTPIWTNAFQRFHIDLGTAKVIKRLYYENYHHSGTYTARGIRNFTLWGSNSAADFADLTYANDGTWTQIDTDKAYFDRHSNSDAVDPKYLTVTNITPYRYYALKIIDNWGEADYVGLRHIELQTQTIFPLSIDSLNSISFDIRASRVGQNLKISLIKEAPIGGTITYDGGYTIHTFTEDDIFIPANDGVIDVQCWGAGGHGFALASSGGGGGGGGAYAASEDVAVTKLLSYKIQVGRKGLGYPERDATPSKFGSNVVVAACGLSATDINGAAGGTVEDSIGDTKYAGGSGGMGHTTGDVGGGGGGCAGPDGTGVNGADAIANVAGTGGDGDNGLGGEGGATPAGAGGDDALRGGGGGGGGVNAGVGGLGGFPGGGGGGSEIKTIPGTGVGALSGSDGEVIIKYLTTSQQVSTDRIEVTPTIEEVDTPQTVTVNLTTLDGDYLRDINKLIIEVINADAENIFYIDNYRSNLIDGFDVDNDITAQENYVSSDSTALQVYADSTLAGAQGNKALKIVANITDSLNEYILRTFKYLQSSYPPLFNTTYVKATSENVSGQEAYKATNPSQPLTGYIGGWYANVAPVTQRFHIDAVTSLKLERLYYENYHYSGTLTNRGASDFTLWGSNSAADFADLTYANDGTWTQIDTDKAYFDRHSNSDAVDPKYITVTTSTPYRYYALKISSNWGGSGIGIRRVELQGYNIDNFDLTDIDTLSFDMLSNRTGENVKLSLINSPNTTPIEITPNILVGDTKQTIVWDISGIVNTDKNNIIDFKVEIVNADAENTFYLDDLKPVEDAPVVQVQLTPSLEWYSSIPARLTPELAWETLPVLQIQLTPSLEWTSYVEEIISPSLEWMTYAVNQLTPKLEWKTNDAIRFAPNIVNYPFYYETPAIVESSVPLLISGCPVGVSISMKNSGNTGNTVINVYNNGTLLTTQTIAATSGETSKLTYFAQDTVMHPSDKIVLDITSVATGAEDLKVNVYLMTFPFDLDKMSIGNIKGTTNVLAINKDYLFNNADYWTIEFNQPITEVLQLVATDVGGVETPLTYTLTSGNFYNTRIRITPSVTTLLSSIAVKVTALTGRHYSFNIAPVVKTYMAAYPAYVFGNTAEFDIFTSATHYTYSLDNGATWSTVLSVSSTDTISLDFTGQTEGKKTIIVNYTDGDKAFSETVKLYYITGDIDCSVQYSATAAKIGYTDVIPFDRAELYYDDVLADTLSPTLITGMDTIVLNTTLKNITVDAGSIYYKNKKYDWTGVALDIVPPSVIVDFITRVRYALVFDLNDTTFYWKAEQNALGTTDELSLLSYSGCILCAVIDVDFSFVYISPTEEPTAFYVSTTTSYVNNKACNLIALDLKTTKEVTIRIIDMAGRECDCTLNNVQTRVNVWRYLTVKRGNVCASSFEGENFPKYAWSHATSEQLWQSNILASFPQWIRYDYGINDKRIIVQYGITPYWTTQNGVPQSWKFQGSNDDSTWVDLHEVIDETGFSSYTQKLYSVSNTTAYAYYRIYITKAKGNVFVKIYDLNFRTVEGVESTDTYVETELLPGEIHQSPQLHLSIDSDVWEIDENNGGW